MLVNYVTLAFHNFIKHRSFTLISLFGLIAGISSALVLVALPLAHYVMQEWLSSFALQTAIHWSVYPGVVFAMSFLALSTTSIRILKATTRNPVESLRTE